MVLILAPFTPVPLFASRLTALLGSFRRLVRVCLDIGLQDSIDTRLVSGALTLEPIDHPRVKTQRKRSLLFGHANDHLFEHGFVDWGNVGEVYLRILHSVQPFPASSRFLLCRCFAHVGSLRFLSHPM